MSKRTMVWLLAFIAFVSTVAYGVTVNGELIRAQLEKLASDPAALEARVYWNTADKVAKIHDGTGWTTLGSGGSSGGSASNFFTNGDAETASVPTAWTTFDDGAVSTPVDGTGGSPATTSAAARTSTAAELLDQTGSYKFVKSAANGQGEGWAYDFSFKDKSPLYSQLVSLHFDYYMSSAAADTMVVYVYDRDNATLITPRFVTCGGGATPVLTATTTACHAQLSWLATTANDYRVIFMITTTGTTAYNYFFDNFYTGQSISAVSSGVGECKSVTFTGSLTTNATYTGTECRVGDRATYSVKIAFSNTNTEGAASLTMPTGRTIDTAKLTSGSGGSSNIIPQSSVVVNDASASAVVGQGGAVAVLSSTSLRLIAHLASGTYGDGSTINTSTNVPITIANGDEIRVGFTVPIAEFAGAQSVGENNVEYACATGTWDAAASTASYGPAGCILGGALTATRTKTVTFLTPINATDAIEVQTSSDGVVWLPANGGPGAASSGHVYTSRAADGTLLSGIVWKKNAANAVDVLFATNANAANDDSPVVAWDSTSYWRVVKHRSGVPVGFGLADASNPGLMSVTSQTFEGTKTFNQAIITGASPSQTGIYVATSASSSTACNTTCATEPASLSSASGTCLAAWNSGTGAPISASTVTACADTSTIARRCMCAGIN